MDYNSLFNFLYSTKVSESTKTEVAKKIEQPIEESSANNPLTETYLELLDTLAFSRISEDVANFVIDKTFNNLSEDFINEVSNEWIKRKVQDSLTSRKNAVDNANKSVKSGIVGLSQLRRQDQAQKSLEAGKAKANAIQTRVNNQTPTDSASQKTEGAIGKMKSAVNKVKSWASPVSKSNDYVGLGRLVGAKANKENIGADNLVQNATHKIETPTTNTPNVDARSERINKAKERAKGIKLPSSGTIQIGTKKEEKQPEVVQAPVSKKKTEAPKAVQQKLDLSTPKEVKAETKDKETVKTEAVKKGKSKVLNALSSDDAVKKGRSKVANAIASTKTSSEAPKEIKADKTSEAPKGNKPASSGLDAETKKLIRFHKDKLKSQTPALERLKKQIEDAEKFPAYGSRDLDELRSRYSNVQKQVDSSQKELEKLQGQKVMAEALSELAILLLNTNISESCFVEVMEMAGANKANALKVKRRYDQDMEASLDDLNKDLEAGKPMDLGKVQKAEELRKKKEHFEKMFNDKFNNNK